MSKQARYVLNKDGRKEHDGFICSSDTSLMRTWACVAVKRDEHGVHIRDTKDETNTTLSFTNAEWRAFTNGVKDGEFD